VHHLVGTRHLADGFATGVTDKTVAWSGKSLLSPFVPQRKRATKFPNTRHSPLHPLFRFLEWRVSLLIPIFCSYDDLPSLILKTLFHH
jgi:hypothetical protein